MNGTLYLNLIKVMFGKQRFAFFFSCQKGNVPMS